MTEILCKTCRYGEVVNDNQTKCLRHPPTPILLNLTRDDKGMLTGTEVLSIFPINGPSTWCGEHEFKTKEQTIDREA